MNFSTPDLNEVIDDGIQVGVILAAGENFAMKVGDVIPGLEIAVALPLVSPALGEGFF